MQNEAKLLSQLKFDDSKELAFKTLIKRYKENLYWHIRKIVISHDDADDVLQNTFIKIFKNIDKFNGDSKLYTWMYRIATNEALNFINSKAKKMGLQNQEWVEAVADGLVADSYFDGDKAALRLQKEVARLPEKQRIVFNMKYFDGMNYDTISEILDTSVGALKASYHHAVKKIKTNLTDEDTKE